MKALIALTTILALTGCATTTVDDRLRAMGATPEYIVGFKHGCSSGKAAAGIIQYRYWQDIPKYKAGGDYAQGWDAAYDPCLRDGQHTVGVARRIRVY